MAHVKRLRAIGVEYDLTMAQQWLSARQEGARLRTALRSAIARVGEATTTSTFQQLQDALQAMQPFAGVPDFLADLAEAKSAVERCERAN